MRCERVIVGAAMVFLTLLFPLRAFAQCYPETYGADPTDQIDDDWAIQQCLNQGGTTMLSPGTPGYLIAGGLQITVDGTTLTAPVRANLKADPVLTEAILQIGSDARYVSNVTLSNVLINGDMWNRDQGLCSGYRGPESNVLIRANNFLIDNVTSKQALCGSSMEVSGSGYEIRNSLFTSNGEQRTESTAPEPWSDGLTLLLCASGNVHDNPGWFNLKFDDGACTPQ